MRKMLLMAVLLMSVTAASAGDGLPLFREFTYSGCEGRSENEGTRPSHYLNPILSGFFPDPSICRKGDDYFLVNSTFSYYPGVPIFHSRDLINWRQLGFVLNRPSQLELGGIRLSGGVYAPAISYNPHNDTFYMVTTIVDGIGNCYVKTKDPFSGVWSEPVVLPQVNGIDPSFFFDEDGKAYLVHNGECPGSPQWEGHRAIWMYEFDWRNDRLEGDKVLLVDGGVDKKSCPVWIEGPHLYKVDGKYLLMCAEGGTGTWHSEVVFTSDSPYGPFIPHRNNPILTQRNLPEERENKVTSTGHADLIQTPGGDWWAVFLGCRPYEGDMYNTGRETFLLPVGWKDGAPVILAPGMQVPVSVESPVPADASSELNGGFSWTDRFREIDHKWLQVRTPETQWWSLDRGLKLIPSGSTLYDEGENPSFLAVRQQHMSFSAGTVLEYVPDAGGIAGLAVYQNEKNNYILGKQLVDGETSVVLYRSDKEHGVRVVASAILKGRDSFRPLGLKVVADGADYTFYYRTGRRSEWIRLGDVQDGRILSTSYAGGFTGTVVGCYAASER